MSIHKELPAYSQCFKMEKMDGDEEMLVGNMAWLVIWLPVGNMASRAVWLVIWLSGCPVSAVWLVIWLPGYCWDCAVVGNMAARLWLVIWLSGKCCVVGNMAYGCPVSAVCSGGNMAARLLLWLVIWLPGYCCGHPPTGHDNGSQALIMKALFVVWISGHDNEGHDNGSQAMIMYAMFVVRISGPDNVLFAW
ncbi:hypothetical protein DPMN_083080 [Dreissena polymorpha]|uniref:Uncharacterized protein n=1 Tax=Dreissena polymorpha TaxID=45954 RepID=A0A9D3Y997_DREPO|nr:hypothetical protein DPMN_083080 [Dreissena polymorpha]